MSYIKHFRFKNDFFFFFVNITKIILVSIKYTNNILESDIIILLKK